MSETTASRPGFFEYEELPIATNRLLTPFTTTGWAEMSMLYASGENGRRAYPYYADSVGIAPHADASHPIRQIEIALEQKLIAHDEPLRSYVYYLGQISQVAGRQSVQKWERELLAETHAQLTQYDIKEPGAKWQIPEFTEQYVFVRSIESAVVLERVAVAAGLVATQNQTEQLYIARQCALRPGNGWLAPLVGLTVDTNQRNDYLSQVHDVLPVVEQTNGIQAVLYGAESALFTADPFRRKS